MSRIKCILILFLFVSLGYTSSAQDTEQVRTIIVKTENIDSINADKLLKEFILSHKPLTINQLNIFNRPKKSGTYGEYVSTYMVESKFYRIDLLPQKRVVTQKVHPNQEWIFYMFVILFLLFSITYSLFPSFLNKMFATFFNPSFISSQAREQHIQSTLPSLLLNFLFIFSASLFIYFKIKILDNLAGLSWWQMISSIILIIFFIYSFKYFFLKFCGWIFNQRDTFNYYIFTISLINKVAGIFMLMASLLSAFTSHATAEAIQIIAIYCLFGLLLVRLIRGIQIFSKQSVVGIGGYLLAFASLELLPTLMVIKFVREFYFLKLVEIFQA